jgi:hypothetical protein
MSTLNDNLTEIQDARDDMKLALEEKGQTVTKDIRTYAEAITNISGGGGTILNVGNSYVSVSGTTLTFEPEHIELEYIQSTGTQYILTSLLISGGYKIVADILMTSGVTGENSFFGWKDYSDSPQEGMECYFNSGKPSAWIRSTSTVTLGNATAYYNQLIHYELEETSSGTTLTLNNSTTYSSSVKLSRASNTPAMIFAYNSEGTADYLFKGKLYSLKIYQNNVLVADYVPCRLNKYNIVCLYDKVNNTYLFNQGSGSFTAGPVVS